MADSTDRRAEERIPVNAGTGCTFAGHVTEDVGPAKIRDVSMTGIGLILSRRVEVGSHLAISVSNAAQKFSKTLVVRVIHVTAVPGGFLVGGTLNEPLTYQELTALVL
jgi:hypothetical protein